MGVRLKTFFAIFLIACSMAWVALWNGYPMVFSGDTGAYLYGGIISVERKWLSVAWSRPPLYNLFTYLAHWQYSLWPIIAIQALIISQLIYLIDKVLFDLLRFSRLIFVGVVVAFVSSASWFVGLILPDFFTSVTVLALFIICFGRRRIGPAEYGYVVMLSIFSVATHYSHVSLAAGLLLVAIGLLVAHSGVRGLFRRELVVLFGVIVLAVGMLSTVQRVFQNEKSFAPYKDLFILARLIGDGPALATLRERCPEAGFKLCAHVDEIYVDSNPYITSDRFLWDVQGPLYKIGVREMRDEAPKIIRASLSDHPLEHVRIAFSNWLVQISTQRTGTWLEPFARVPGDGTTKIVQEYFPNEFDAFVSSRQNTEALHLEMFSNWHFGVVMASVLFGVAMSVRFARAGQFTFVAFFVSVVAALLGNSLTSGVLSRPDDRYMSRLTWMLVLYATFAFWAHKVEPLLERTTARAFGE